MSGSVSIDHFLAQLAFVCIRIWPNQAQPIDFDRVGPLLGRDRPINFHRIRFLPGPPRSIGSHVDLPLFGPEYRPDRLPVRPVLDSSFLAAFYLSIELNRGSVLGLLVGHILPSVYARLEPYCLLATTSLIFGLMSTHWLNYRSLRNLCEGIRSFMLIYLVFLFNLPVLHFSADTFRLSGLTLVHGHIRRSL